VFENVGRKKKLLLEELGVFKVERYTLMEEVS
jgi:hypothetical protein